MSRITFCDDEDFNNQALMWEANQRRSIKGRKGQAALRELESALLALPDKRLVANDLETPEGEVCAVGALAKFKGIENPKREQIERAESVDTFYDEDPMEKVTLGIAQELGVPKMVAVAIMAENDDDDYHFAETPEGRYERILRWTRSQLADA